MIEHRVCSIQGCDNKHFGKGLCNKHYVRVRSNGDVTFGRHEADYCSRKFWQSVAITADPSQCWLWLLRKNNCGYGQVNRDGRTQSAHRMAWILTHGSIPQDKCVMHLCDNRLCVNPSHLQLGSLQENIVDRDNKHRTAKGRQSGQAKLTESIVQEIRTSIESGVVLARTFHVTPAAISAVRKRKSWAHV